MADAPPLRVLATYAYMNDNYARAIAAAGDRVELLLDSGAFTAWQKGKHIALDEYCAFLDRLPFRPSRYFTLDVVGDHAATRRQYDAMRARGYSPVPIFTRGSPYSEIADYAATSDVVGVGGLAGKQGNRYAYLKAMVPQARGAPLHILGVTSPDWIKHFRPYSCDSSTWIGAGRYGAVNLYMGRGRWENFRPGDLDARPAGAVAARIARYGLDPYALARKDKAWQRLNEMGWAEFALDIREALGTRLFLAAAIPADFARALELRGKDVQIETSGTQPVRASLRAWVTLSPKIGMPGGFAVREDAVERADEIKMPAGSPRDTRLLL